MYIRYWTGGSSGKVKGGIIRFTPLSTPPRHTSPFTSVLFPFLITTVRYE